MTWLDQFPSTFPSNFGTFSAGGSSTGVALGVGTAGAMVDVTAYVNGPEGVPYQWGRTDEFQDPRTGSWSIILDNYDGRFTPGTSAVYPTPISEGTAVAWGIGNRIVTGVVTGFDFPDAEDQQGRVTITVGDVFVQANRTTVDSLSVGIGEAAAFLWWPMDDSSAASWAVESSGNGGPRIGPGGVFGAAPSATMTFGTAATGPTGNQAALGQPDAPTDDSIANEGGVVTFPTVPYTAGSFGYWGMWVTGAYFTMQVRIYYPGITTTLFWRISSWGVSADFDVTSVPFAAYGAGPHFLSVGMTYSGSTLTTTTYVDGVAVRSNSGTHAGLTAALMQPGEIQMELGNTVTTGFLPVDIAHLSLSTALLHEEAAATTTEAGRLAAIAQIVPGLTFGTIDPALSTAPFAGDVTNAWVGICDVLKAEQGHIYPVTTGTITSPTTVVNVRARTRPSTPAVTLDAAKDLQGTPKFVRDITNMFTRITANGPVTYSYATDSALAARVGSSSTTENVGLVNTTDLHDWATDRLLRGENTAVRPIAIIVDTFTSETVALNDILGLVPGDRIRVANIPSNSLNITTFDGWLLGADEVHAFDRDQFTLYVAPVLASTGVFDTDLFGAGGELKLSASMTNSQTTMSVASIDGVTKLATSGFPYTLIVDSEQVTVTACTSATPQVATITRHVNGTTAATHAANALVDLATVPIFAF